SVTQTTGESDLEISFVGPDGGRWRLLIENKIAASFQAQQAERYRQRGATYIERGDCGAFYTILVAPEDYFGSPDSLKGFDGRVTYEALKAWFLQREALGVRLFYNATILTLSLKNSWFGYQPMQDMPVSDFWQAYWKLAQKCAPELNMPRPPAKPSGAGFIYFRPHTLPPGL